MPQAIAPQQLAARLTELWSPRVIAELDDNYVKVAKLSGEFYIVPKGVRHNPVATQEVNVLLIERKSTLHSGGEVTD